MNAGVHAALLTVHICSALGIAFALGLEFDQTLQIRRARTAADLRPALRGRRIVLLLGPPDLGLLLVSGLLLSLSHADGWVPVAIGGVVATAVVGASMTGPVIARLTARAAGHDEPLNHVALSARLVTSLALRIGLTLGITVTMVVRPRPWWRSC